MEKLAGKVSLIFCLLSANICICGQKASISEETKQILTYPYSDPNPVPAMAVSSMAAPFYPYFVFDGYTDKGIQKAWKVVSLDNDYINVTVLPEVGGKVWGATEKSTGLEFVYQNHVMKFRAIGIRGPWTSGGIEHNFGLDLGHAPWTASPVDYLVSKNSDGSVSCTVGGLDIASETEWRVTIQLPKDKTYFETKSMWYNPGPLHDAYLSWENAGFSASGNLQFFFPGNYYIGHDGSVNPWPVDNKGRDLSWYKNNNFGSSKSYHVSGYFTDWFGGYWHDLDFGFGHSAPYSDAPGKKIWIWSLARDGAIWEDLLTDKDGQYIEAQSGVKFNQANRESGYDSPFNQLSMRPHYTETKTEYWFPVLGTKGISDASAYGTLNAIIHGDSLNIIISPNAEINDSLIISLDGKHLKSAYIHLKPARVFRENISVKDIKYKTLEVRLGNDLLNWNSENRLLETGRPSRTLTDQDFTSSEHLFRLAEDMNAMREYDEALDHYLACLKKEPTHSRALYRVAELYYRMADYDTGLRYAKRILENDTYEGGGNFICGMIYRITGDLMRAEEAYSVAARTMEYRSAAYVEMAGIRMQRKDFNGAVEYAGKALDYNRLNIQAYWILATGYRKLGMTADAGNILNELLRLDPLCHYARFEQYLLNPSDEKLKTFQSMIRNELPQETYLGIAVRYVSQGLIDEAEQVLSKAPSCPMVWYWLAWLSRESSPDQSNGYLVRAEEMSPYLVFPHGLEAIPVLTWATEKDNSWKSKYYLGLIYWHLRRNDKAAELFEKCGDLPDYAPFYIARGSLFRNIPTEYCQPCSDFSTAVKLDPSEWRTWHYQISFLQGNGAFAEELKNASLAYSKFPANPVIGTDYAKALLNSGKYAECISVLKKVRILPQEGAHEGHDILDLANMSLAVSSVEKGKYRDALKYTDESRKWPENLGAGKPYQPDNRFQDFVAARCYEKIGDKKLSGEYQQRIADFTASQDLQEQDPLSLFIAASVMTDMGKKAMADEIIKRWTNVQDSLFNWSISAGSSSPKARWLIAKNKGDKSEADELERQIASDPSENRFRLVLRTYNYFGKD